MALDTICEQEFSLPFSVYSCTTQCPVISALLYFSSRYGIILRELSMTAQAREKLVKSCELTPLLWSAWQELAKLCKSREMVSWLLNSGKEFTALLL